jgi:hypothetical protein
MIDGWEAIMSITIAGIGLGVLVILATVSELLALILPLGLAGLAMVGLFVAADNAREVGLALLAAGAIWALGLVVLDHVVEQLRFHAWRDRCRRE